MAAGSDAVCWDGGWSGAVVASCAFRTFRYTRFYFQSGMHVVIIRYSARIRRAFAIHLNGPLRES